MTPRNRPFARPRAGGFAVREAVDGREPIELHQTWQPDLILMDLRMPGMDGLTASRVIRDAESGNPESEKTVIVALSAEAFAENREKTLSGGCDDFITKPFRESGLFEVLSAHLSVRYVYEEPSEVNAIEAGETLRELAPRLRRLSPALLEELEQSAAALEPQRLERVIETIRPHDIPRPRAWRPSRESATTGGSMTLARENLALAAVADREEHEVGER